jgi:hypothetical protein
LTGATALADRGRASPETLTNWRFEPMPRCKPGDLAIVISAHNRANVGRIVQVLRLHDGRGDLVYRDTADTIWLVRDAGGRRMVWRSKAHGQVWRRRLGPVPDGQLQPIRGEPDSVETNGQRGARHESRSEEKSMTEFDMHFRPSAYFGPLDAETFLASTIKGEVRRRAILERMERGELEGLDPVLAESDLDEEMRTALGRVHPRMMGGEYLPPLQDEEVEIARISLESTTFDQISVRARRDGKRIRYRICDEYETGFEVRPESSAQPLTMGELIGLIDGADEHGLVLGPIAGNLDGGSDVDSMRGFVTVSSAFYPQLGAWYEREIGSYLAKLGAGEEAAATNAEQDAGLTT